MLRTGHLSALHWNLILRNNLPYWVISDTPYLPQALDLPALPYIKEPCMWESQCLDNDHLFPLSEKYPLYEQSCNFSTCQMFVHLSKYLSKLVGAYYLQTKGYPRERVLNKMILQRGHFRNGQTFGFHFILHVSIHQIFLRALVSTVTFLFEALGPVTKLWPLSLLSPQFLWTSERFVWVFKGWKRLFVKL